MRQWVLVGAMLVLVGMRVHADPQELLRDAALFGRFETLVARIDMEIRDRGVKTRTLELYVEQDDGQHKALAQVIAPAFLSRMKYLTIGDARRTDQWIATSRGVRSWKTSRPRATGSTRCASCPINR